MTEELEADMAANDPEALAASIGRKSLGKERFQRLSAAGRRRAHLARSKGVTPEKTMELGGGGRFIKMVKRLSQRRGK